MAVEHPAPAQQDRSKGTAVSAPDIATSPSKSSSLLAPEIHHQLAAQDVDHEAPAVTPADHHDDAAGGASLSAELHAAAEEDQDQQAEEEAAGAAPAVAQPTEDVAELKDELLLQPHANGATAGGDHDHDEATSRVNGGPAAAEPVRKSAAVKRSSTTKAGQPQAPALGRVLSSSSSTKGGSDKVLKQQPSIKVKSVTKPATTAQGKAGADQDSSSGADTKAHPPLKSPRKAAGDHNATPEKVAASKGRRKPTSEAANTPDKSPAVAANNSTPDKATPEKTAASHKAAAAAGNHNSAPTTPRKATPDKVASFKAAAAASAQSTPEQGTATTPVNGDSSQTTTPENKVSTPSSKSAPGRLSVKSNLRIQSSVKRSSVSPRTPKTSKARLFSPKTNGNSPGSEDEPKVEEDTPTKTRRVKLALVEAYMRHGNDALGPDSPNIGPTLLKLAKTYHATGESPQKALLYAKHAAKYFETTSQDQHNLDLVLSLHILGALHCRLGQYQDAIPALERSLTIPDLQQGLDHCLALFAGHMQLGDTYSLMGNHEQALQEYHKALKVQEQSLGNSDPRLAETCRYVAEAHLQAMQFDEAEALCQEVLRIHGSHSPPGATEQAADRKLMALVYSGKGDYEKSLEHLEMAGATLLASGQDLEAANVDVTIGETYVAMGRHEEAVASYQKALSVLKTAKGETDAAVATVYISLAELHLKQGNSKEAKAHCENALKIYGKNGAGLGQDEIAAGLTEVGAIYEGINEREQALHLLQKALSILDSVPGQQSAAAGIQAQMGVMYYVLGRHTEALNAYKGAVVKIRAGGEQRKPLLGLLLNQMGLVWVELYEIDDAAEIFEEARAILEETSGPTHPDTLAVCTNLAGTYDAQGRSDEAIRLLEFILQEKEERLGTVHPDTAEERAVLVDLLRAVGRSRRRKSSTLQELLDIAHEESKRFREGA